MPEDTTYASLDEFVASTGTDTQRIKATPNAKHQQMLNTAARLVDTYTRGVRLGVEAFSATDPGTVRTFDHIPALSHYHPIGDALAVTAVAIDGTAITDTYYTLRPLDPGDGPYTHLVLRRDATYYYGSSTEWYTSTVGYGRLVVTGTWGYCDSSNRPPEIKEATLKLAIRLYELDTLGKRDLIDAALGMRDLKLLDPTVVALLAPFRKGGVRIA